MQHCGGMNGWDGIGWNLGGVGYGAPRGANNDLIE